MPLIQYEQREGPSCCESTNAPSSGSHIDPFLCEAAMKTAHRLSMDYYKRQRRTRGERIQKGTMFILVYAEKVVQYLRRETDEDNEAPLYMTGMLM